jgi:NAD(P)-dependent dehydrogenase (short-subunit alcohol dehydrogenase family)
MLKNKVVVITGAGGGLGRALVDAFVKEGALVVGLGRSINGLKETKTLVDSPLFSYYQVDVSDYQHLEKVIQLIIDAHYRIDYLFNNAAVYPKVNFLEEAANEFSAAIDINVSGVANCCKAVLPIMIKNQFGRIFNVGSWADLSPTNNSAAYCASKGAIHALTKAIAVDIEHANADVHVHEWIPGELKTQMSDFTGIEPSLSASWAVQIAKSDNLKPNCIFERDREWLPPKSLKQRMLSKLLFWKS